MEDPFASLTSGMIHKPTMKQQSQQKPASPARPPSGGAHRPLGGTPQAPPGYGQPMGGRYPSPMPSGGARATSDTGIKHAGSEGSLSSLSGLGDLAFSVPTKGQTQSMRTNAMKPASADEAPRPPAATPTPPRKQTPPPAASADDFDSMFGAVPGKAGGFGDSVGVDVFDGGVPAGKAPPASSADPFDMFCDFGESVSHAPAVPTQTPSNTPLHTGSPTGDGLLPGLSGELVEEALPPSPPPPAVAAPQPTPAAPQAPERGVVGSAPGATYEPPAHGAVPQGHSQESPPPPSYEDVLQMARRPPTSRTPLERRSPAHSSPNVSGRGGLPRAASLSAPGSREDAGKKKGVFNHSLVKKLEKEGGKLGGLLMKHGAKAAAEAQKALKEGMSSVRGAMAENLNRPSAQNSWRYREDGEVESPGVERARSAVHIQMAETLLGVDSSTREAMISAMDPDDRMEIESILAEISEASPGHQVPRAPPSQESTPAQDIPPRPARTSESRSSNASAGLSPAGSTGSPAVARPASPQAAAASPFAPFAESAGKAEPPPAAPVHQEAAPAARPPPPKEEEETVDFLFNPAPAASGAAPAAAPTGPAGWDEFANPAPAPAAPADSMFGNLFGDDGSDARSSSLSEASCRVNVRVDSHETDTVERSALRAARAARVQKRIDDQLAEKLQRDKREADEREQQADLKSRVAGKVGAWKKKCNGNIVALLASLDDVLWEGSGWKAIPMGDLLSDAGVKKGWRKANLLVHPDKVKQKGGDVETLVLADYIFDNLKESYAKYKPMGV